MCWASAACAQQSGAGSTLYGRGVDAYYSGNTAEAEQFLSQAIAALPDDPRPYYFRGLSLLRSGRQDEARTDMAAGATLEARRPKQFAVGTALERVQGNDRLLLEQFRRKGQATAAIERDDQNRGRYDQRVESDTRLLRETAAPGQSTSRTAAPVPASVDGNPFADEAPQPKPQSPPADATSDPFGAVGGAASSPPEKSTLDKAPSGKLMRVLGRVLEKTVPLPSVEGLRNRLPTSPVGPSPVGPTPDTPAPQPTNPQKDAKASPAGNSEDPFGGQ
jgi:hypothetical protein